jgi:uroporphyrinogen-III decarboxylase
MHMTGRQRIEAALSKKGTADIPAVICYEGIFTRDHWQGLTSYPWWYQESPRIDIQMLWRREIIKQLGQDWLLLPEFYSRDERRDLIIEVRPAGVFRVNTSTGEATKLLEPPVGGLATSGPLAPVHPEHLAETTEEVDELIPPAPRASRDGSHGDLAAAMLDEFGDALFPIASVDSPLTACYFLWGFEGMMVMVATRPDLVEYACRRYLELRLQDVRDAAALGAAGIWIEDCLTDMISPVAFQSLNVAYLVPLVEAIRAAGMSSIHYFTGNPAGKWDQILSIGADALALEESKKGFTIDIEAVVERVGGRCTVLGNLDAIGILQDGSEEVLRTEMARQIEAGRRNNSRFIMSIGSPVTPATPVERVRLYCDMIHELGRS